MEEMEKQEVSEVVEPATEFVPEEKKEPIGALTRCKFCREVLEYDTKFCPNCGKNTSKTPSKKFLKERDKRDAFQVNNDAKLYRVSYKIFAVIFLILSLVSFAFYGQYLFKSFGNEDLAIEFVSVVDKAFGINTTINDILPYNQGALSFFFVICAGALVLTFFSLFTKKRASKSATFYKLATLIGLLFIVAEHVLKEFLKLEFVESDIFNYVRYGVAGLSLVFFVLAFIFGFWFKNPYRATLYQGLKTIFFCGITWLTVLVSLLKLDASFINYIVYNVPAYLFVASMLLFIGAKYRGDISRLV